MPALLILVLLLSRRSNKGAHLAVLVLHVFCAHWGPPATLARTEYRIAQPGEVMAQTVSRRKSHIMSNKYHPHSKKNAIRDFEFEYDEDELYVKSHKYYPKGPYPKSRQVLWIFKADNKKSIIKFIHIFDVEVHVNCEYDQVNIFTCNQNMKRCDALNLWRHRAGPFCGSRRPKPIEFNKVKYIAVDFFSDPIAKAPKRGFVFQYWREHNCKGG